MTYHRIYEVNNAMEFSSDMNQKVSSLFRNGYMQPNG